MHCMYIAVYILPPVLASYSYVYNAICYNTLKSYLATDHSYLW